MPRALPMNPTAFSIKQPLLQANRSELLDLHDLRIHNPVVNLSPSTSTLPAPDEPAASGRADLTEGMPGSSCPTDVSSSRDFGGRRLEAESVRRPQSYAKYKNQFRHQSVRYENRDRALDEVSFAGTNLIEPDLLSTRVGVYEVQTRLERDPLAGSGYGMQFSDGLTEMQFGWYHSLFRLDSMRQLAHLMVAILTPVLILGLLPPRNWTTLSGVFLYLPMLTGLSLWLKKQKSLCEDTLVGTPLVGGVDLQSRHNRNVENRQSIAINQGQGNDDDGNFFQNVFSGDFRVWSYVQLASPKTIDMVSIAWLLSLAGYPFFSILRKGTTRGPFLYMIALLSCAPAAMELSFLLTLAINILSVASFIVIYMTYGDTSSWISNVLSLCTACFSGSASSYNQSRNRRIQFVNLSILSSNLFGLIEAMQSTRLEMMSAMKYVIFTDRNLESDFQIFAQVDSRLTVQISTFVQCVASIRYLMPQFGPNNESAKKLLFLRSVTIVPLWGLLFFYQLRYMGSKSRLYFTVFVSIVCILFDFVILQSLDMDESRDFFPVFWRTHEALLTSLSVPFHISMPICVISVLSQIYLMVEGNKLFRDIYFMQSLMVLYGVIAFHSYRGNIRARLAFWIRKKKRTNFSQRTSIAQGDTAFDSLP